MNSLAIGFPLVPLVFVAAAAAWYIAIPVLLWKILQELRRIRQQATDLQKP